MWVNAGKEEPTWGMVGHFRTTWVNVGKCGQGGLTPPGDDVGSYEMCVCPAHVEEHT